MLVCTRCGRSLEDVALVGRSAGGDELGRTSATVPRLAGAVLLVAVAAAIPVLLIRVLRSSNVEAASAATPSPSVARSAAPAPDGRWQTLEQRWAAVVPPPTPLPTPPPTPPPATLAPPAPSLSDVPPDPARLRAIRRAVLRRAQERLRALEERADELRRRSSEAADADEYETLQRELQTVRRQMDEAQREVVRAEWRLAEVEPAGDSPSP